MTMTRYEDAQQVMRHADCLHDAAAVAAAYDRMAAAIRADYAGKNPLILCVMTGGAIPAAEILRRLDFPFEFDYLHATRYRGETTGSGLLWKAYPEISLRERHVLAIDDILDEGHTLKAIRDFLDTQESLSVKIAVLADKLHARKALGVQADYVGLTVEDRYVFGCGMDYKGYWRQLPGIWAVRS
jgi:hypoxanthine phosphoribosyltransferase